MGRTQGLGDTNIVPFSGDLIETHIHAGNRARAEELLAWLDELASTTGLVYPGVAAARCRGMLCRDIDAAARQFAHARALQVRREMSFEAARTSLCEAQTLRRLRRPAAARCSATRSQCSTC